MYLPGVKGLILQLCVFEQGDIRGRAPGDTTLSVSAMLRPGEPQGYVTAFDPSGGGCGAAMRSMCIGLVFRTPAQIDDLISVSVESGRMTHNHPTGVTPCLVQFTMCFHCMGVLKIRQ